MSRYIDAENAKSYIYGQFVDRVPQDILDAVVRGVDDIESEDVAPVVHAHWVDTLYGWRCSNCEEEQEYTLYFKHCPNCGAKMDEEVE